VYLLESLDDPFAPKTPKNAALGAEDLMWHKDTPSLNKYLLK
jgi:hypothetical protein